MIAGNDSATTEGVQQRWWSLRKARSASSKTAWLEETLELIVGGGGVREEKGKRDDDNALG